MSGDSPEGMKGVAVVDLSHLDLRPPAIESGGIRCHRIVLVADWIGQSGFDHALLDEVTP